MPTPPPQPQTPFWKQPFFWVTLSLLPMVYMVVWLVLTGSFSAEMKAMVITAIMSTTLAALTSFWFAGSTGERKKDDAIIANASSTTPPTTITGSGPTTVNSGSGPTTTTQGDTRP